MEVNFGGIIPISTIDWYGKAAIVIFFRKCPLRCPFCQNYKLLDEDEFADIKEIEAEIEKAKDFVNAVVFSGGEPMMQFEQIKSLAGFAKRCKLLVGIETNGCYPERLKELIEKNLVDKVFLDVKAPLSDPELYSKVIGADGAKTVSLVKRSLEICKDRLEVRTTVFKGLIFEKEHIKAIAGGLPDVTYVIQQGRPEQGPSEELKQYGVPSRDELVELAKVARQFLSHVRIRTKEFGEEVIT
ncbi:MAG: anaerobic ribonucleoside-triphosphate reductase activating protein [Methanocellales archaeon]|nr:anaerobic ribonucleoside-triphosphate reductase activating protein [Methanocellales archaeon]MDD3292372.1 anaerobic ribonucleoside-triphosphate reductase activating protein [Methanocellales archaeon]MDD5236028.1 anaerobic ribonucleoside-triphosphate reductase activating protein [Methanocellales archaeon]MDD5485860.1 anaerobic ribonucleoside-triphosphate reductase activating protein [Methanocellales archaeon]